MSVGIHTSNGFVKVAGISMGESLMIGATENKNGKAGIVPAPTVEDKDKFLKGNGVWAEIDLHNHKNETVLNKLSESSDGVLLFNGKEIQGGSSGENIDFENEDIDFSIDY